MQTADLASEDGGSPVQLQACSTFSDPSTDDAPVLPPWDKAHRGSAAGDEKGRTPLHYACYTGDVKKTQLLCRMGADPEARDDKVRLRCTPHCVHNMDSPSDNYCGTRILVMKKVLKSSY